MSAQIRMLFDPPVHRDGPFSGDKILWHADEIRKLAEGGNPVPITAEIDLTNACDLKCPYCSQKRIREHAETLDGSIAVMAIEDLVDLGCKGVVFTGGGEPLLHKSSAELIAYSHYRGLDVAVITNGLRLNHVNLEQVVENCTWIRVSLDAHDQDSYRESKGLDRFEEAIKNVRLLVRVREETGSPVTIGIGYVTHSGNFAELPEAAKLARSLGVDYLQARPLIFEIGDERSTEYPLGYDPESLAEARLQEREGFRVYASTPKYEDLTRQRPYQRCYGLYFATSIGASGDVWACCHSRGIERLSLGNVHQRSLKDIWLDIAHRRQVYERINLAECMPLCRMHATNRLLERLNWHPQHESFL